MSGAQPVGHGIFARPDQVSRRFLFVGGHPNFRELPRPIELRQFLRITPIRLDAIAGAHGGQARGDHRSLAAQTVQLPLQRIATRSRFSYTNTAFSVFVIRFARRSTARAWFSIVHVS